MNSGKNKTLASFSFILGIINQNGPIFIVFPQVYSSFLSYDLSWNAHSGLTLSLRFCVRVFRTKILRPFRTPKRALQTCGGANESLCAGYVIFLAKVQTFVGKFTRKRAYLRRQ